MQTEPTLAKITASHFQVQNTQFAYGNMPERILIAYLNENLRNCNENLDKNPSFIPNEKSVKTSFLVHFM